MTKGGTTTIKSKSKSSSKTKTKTKYCFPESIFSIYYLPSIIILSIPVDALCAPLYKGEASAPRIDCTVVCLGIFMLNPFLPASIPFCLTPIDYQVSMVLMKTLQ